MTHAPAQVPPHYVRMNPHTHTHTHTFFLSHTLSTHSRFVPAESRLGPAAPTDSTTRSCLQASFESEVGFSTIEVTETAKANAVLLG